MSKIEINDDDWDVDLDNLIITHNSLKYEGELISLKLKPIEGQNHYSIIAPWSLANSHEQDQEIYESAMRAFNEKTI